MKSLVVIAVACCGSIAYAQNPPSGNPFVDRSDTGQTVHVLPTPASVHSPRDTQPTDAPPHSGTAVYPASYGSGNLNDHGGPEIGNAGFQQIYFNSSVAGSKATSLGYPTIQAEIAAFAGDFPNKSTYTGSTTDDYSIIQQYGSSVSIAPTLANNPVISGGFVDSKATVSKYSDSQIQAYLSSLFGTGPMGQPNENTLYGIYFPPSMRICLQGGCSCSSFCGYHSHYTDAASGKVIKYAVFPYPNCMGCSLSGKSVADMLTIVSSHEIREAVTDSLGTAWYDQSGYEADDKCAWHNLYQMTNGGFWVQPEYSNGGTVSGSGVSYPGPGCVVPK